MKIQEIVEALAAATKQVEELNAMVAQLDARCTALEAEPAKAEKLAKACNTKEGSIADTTVALLKAGNKPKDVLSMILEKHAGAKTTLACVYWYKTRINKGLYAD